MRLKLDENLSRHLKTTLTPLGHDVSTVADEGLLSMPDTVVGKAARAESRMLLTLDVEFGDLRKHPPGSHPGIVLFRSRSFGPESVNRFVERFVQTAALEELSGAIVVVDPGRVRVRKPPKSGS